MSPDEQIQMYRDIAATLSTELAKWLEWAGGRLGIDYLSALDDEGPIEARRLLDERLADAATADNLEAQIHGDGGFIDRIVDLEQSKSNAHEFVRFIATQCAYNGADDQGQRFYDQSLNPWLSKQLERFFAQDGDA